MQKWNIYYAKMEYFLCKNGFLIERGIFLQLLFVDYSGYIMVFISIFLVPVTDFHLDGSVTVLHIRSIKEIHSVLAFEE